jgi:hypothetical protein
MLESRARPNWLVMAFLGGETPRIENTVRTGDRYVSIICQNIATYFFFEPNMTTLAIAISADVLRLHATEFLTVKEIDTTDGEKGSDMMTM